MSFCRRFNSATFLKEKIMRRILRMLFGSFIKSMKEESVSEIKKFEAKLYVEIDRKVENIEELRSNLKNSIRRESERIREKINNL